MFLLRTERLPESANWLTSTAGRRVARIHLCRSGKLLMGRIFGADHGQILCRLFLERSFKLSALLVEANGLGDVSQLVVRPAEVKRSRGSQLGVAPKKPQRGPNRSVRLGEFSLFHGNVSDQPVCACAQKRSCIGPFRVSCALRFPRAQEAPAVFPRTGSPAPALPGVQRYSRALSP